MSVCCACAAPAAWCAEGTPIPAADRVDGAAPPAATYVAMHAEHESAGDLGQRVDNATLAGLSGGTMVIQDTTLTGTVNNNSADRVVTGDNLITGGSLSAATGFPTVIQNSGNNVLIQNATVLNVQFKP
jgi:hypothetical protein